MRKIILFFTLMLTMSVNAGIYKWTDEKGNVHFGDRPVNQREVIELIYDTESRAGITNSSGHNKERERMAKELENDRKERQSNREERRVVQKKQRKRCTRARDQLLQYQQSRRLYKLKDNGERVYLDDKQRQSTVKKLNKVITKNCR